MAPTKDEIIAILRRYRVQKHWRASSEARMVRYAVFLDGEPLTEPALHREANEQREQLVAGSILGLFADAVRS